MLLKVANALVSALSASSVGHVRHRTSNSSFPGRCQSRRPPQCPTASPYPNEIRSSRRRIKPPLPAALPIYTTLAPSIQFSKTNSAGQVGPFLLNPPPALSTRHFGGN